MTGRLLQGLARLVLLVALAGSGFFVGVSMYRWEWQRATFGAIVFVGTLAVVLVLVLLRRLDQLERRLDQTTLRSQSTLGREVVLPTAPETVTTRPSKDFAWLAPADSTFVFVPLLLGFGVVVSLLAMVLERIAGFLVGTPNSARSQPHSSQPAAGGNHRRTAVLAGAAFGITVLLAGLLTPTVAHLIYDPGPPQPGYRVVDVEVQARRVTIDAEASMSSLAVYCRAQTGTPIEIVDVTETRPGLVRILVKPRLDTEAQRRFEGCLGDLVMDRHLTRVVGSQDVPVTTRSTTGSAPTQGQQLASARRSVGEGSVQADENLTVPGASLVAEVHAAVAVRRHLQ